VVRRRQPRRCALKSAGQSLAALVAALCALCGARLAQAQGPPLACGHAQAAVRCELNLAEAFGPQVQSRLRTGLLNRFLYRIYIRRIEDDEPVSLAALQQYQVYELWDEVHYLFEDQKSLKKRSTAEIKEVLSSLTSFQGLIIADGLPPGRYYADLIVELNPLSEQDEAAIRSWIARNRGGHRTFASGGRSLFGTFVSLFVNIRPGNAEWSYRARSKPFTVAP
jgi:hypothetical protein